MRTGRRTADTKLTKVKMALKRRANQANKGFVNKKYAAPLVNYTAIDRMGWHGSDTYHPPC
jgi:hypothetical protein